MVVVDGVRAEEQRIETQLQQSGLESKPKQQQAEGKASKRSSQPRSQRQPATKAAAHSGTIKQNKTKPEFYDFFNKSNNITPIK